MPKLERMETMSLPPPSRRLACLVLVALAASAAPASASVVMVDLVPDFRMLQDTTYSFDINNDGVRDIRFIRQTGTLGLSAYPDAHVRLASVPSDPGSHYLWPLSSSIEVGANLPSPAQWAYEPYPGPFGVSILISLGFDLVTLGYFPGVRGFVGMELTLADGVHYGYLELSVLELSTLGTVHSYAFETQPGVPITTVLTPEPGRTGLLLLAAMALMGRRRRVFWAG